MNATSILKVAVELAGAVLIFIGIADFSPAAALIIAGLALVITANGPTLSLIHI